LNCKTPKNTSGTLHSFIELPFYY